MGFDGGFGNVDRIDAGVLDLVGIGINESGAYAAYR